MLPLLTLNHVAFVCSSLEESLHFYRDILGFQEIERPSAINKPGHWLWGYGIALHLIVGKCPPKSREINPVADHISFQAEDIENVKAQLQKANIRFLEKFLHDEVTLHQLFFHDPNENMIEVCNCADYKIQPKQI
jgi:catechol 2,3-dioxygenase-like lactoylglutathione lyase family enzyme